MAKLLPSLLVALLLVIPGVTSSAVGAEVVTTVDKQNDVHIARGETGLPFAKRRTVDLRRLTVTPSEAGPVVELQLRRIVANGTFDQYFYVYFESADDDGFPIAYFMVKASSLRGQAGAEGTEDPEGYASCRVHGTVSNQRKTLTVIMPKACTPTGSITVRVLAYTTPLGERGGEFAYSTDRVRIRDAVDIQD